MFLKKKALLYSVFFNSTILQIAFKVFCELLYLATGLLSFLAHFFFCIAHRMFDFIPQPHKAIGNYCTVAQCMKVLPSLN